MTKIRIDLSEYESLLRDRTELRGERYRVEALLNKVIDALGLRESYQDETTTVEQVNRMYFGPHQSPQNAFQDQTFMQSITVTGASRFKADVEKAADAARGEEALNRLRNAMKEAKR